MKSTQQVTEGAILLAVFTVLLLVTVYVPLLGGLVMFFLALPFIMYTAKYNWKAGLVFLLVAIFLTFITATFMSIPLTLIFGTTGVVIGYCFHKNKSRLSSLIAGTLVFLINVVIVYVISAIFFNINYVNEMVKTVQESLDMSVKMTEALGQTIDQKQLDQIQQNLKLIPTLMPSLLVISSILVVFLVQLVSVPIMRRMRIHIPKWKPFRELMVPKSMLWYYLITMLASLLIKPSEGTFAFAAILNLLYILQIFIVFQGLSLVFYYCYQKGYSKAVPIVVTIVSFILPIGLYIVRILGIIDLGFDIRKNIRKN